MRYALVAELVDASDLGSDGQPWGFESLLAHHNYCGVEKWSSR